MDSYPIPVPGDMVWYQTDGRNFDYYLPAIVSVTLENQNIEGLNTAGIPLVTGPERAHLRVISPGEDYVEHDVPFSPEGDRRSWRWPERVAYTAVTGSSEPRPFSRGEDPSQQGPFTAGD